MYPVALTLLLGTGASVLPVLAASPPAQPVEPTSTAAAFEHFSELDARPVTALKDAPIIRTLSNRADLISGGDALVEVIAPAGGSVSDLRIEVGGRDVTSSFGTRSTDGRFVGLIGGLAVGENVVTARAGNRKPAELTITNHPTTGPIFAGAQPQPWFCNAEANGFGPAQDADCTVAPKYDFLYLSTNPVLAAAGLQPYDPANPPTDVADTTTDQGKSVPFIVRRETGVMDRGWYQWAVLYNPSKPWTAQQPQDGWNRKLYWPVFGGGCGTEYYQGNPPNVISGDAATRLGQGFALAAGTLQVAATNCNVTIVAESVMMQHERIQEQYGELRYVIAAGCSGGSMLIHQLANAYPGLLHGLLPACSHSDADWHTQTAHHIDVVSNYFNMKSPHLWASEHQRAAVFGTPSTVGYTTAKTLLIPGQGHPDNAAGCGASSSQPWMWSEENPTGTRCTWQDFRVGVYGKRTDGYGRRPWTNEGMQYGLNGLLSGVILPEQFVDLNEKVGGLDINHGFQDARTTGADNDNLPAFTTLHRTSGLNDGRHLDLVPIIILQATTGNYEFHPDAQARRLKERMVITNGHADNNVLVLHQGVLTQPAPPELKNWAFTRIDQWLASMEADDSGASLPEKVLANRPADAVDSCHIGPKRITDPMQCRALYPYGGDFQTAAGQDNAALVSKCALRPLNRQEYSGLGVTFTDDQWARLQKAFPTGVCDWRKPGVGQVASVPWIDFGNRFGDGRPLDAAPSSVRARGAATAAPGGAATAAAGGAGLTGAAPGSLPTTGGSGLAALAGAVLLGSVLLLRRRPRHL